MGEKPEEEGQDDAEKKASNNRKVKSGVLAAVDDIAWEFSEAKGKPAAEAEECADEDKEAAKEEKNAAKFARGVHGASVIEVVS